VNEIFYSFEISLPDSPSRVQSGFLPSQSVVSEMRPIEQGTIQVVPDSYRDWFSGPAPLETRVPETESDLRFWQSSPNWPIEPRLLQRRSGTLILLATDFWAFNDPYSSVTTATPLAGESQNLTWAVSREQQVSPSVAEHWETEDDRRFDLLVEREALDELSFEEAKELEQLSDKRDRTVARVPEEDLLQEKMRCRALTELQELLEKYAPLFARRP
jgi:hypothetical protein